MKNTLKINHEEREIIMDRTFAKFAENTRSEEYAHLQQVRKDYPTYTVTLRKIKKNPNKKSYEGLTYQYMEDYIATHEEVGHETEVLAVFHDMIFVSQCQAKARRYPVIKKWFLDRYPEVAEFGVSA